MKRILLVLALVTAVPGAARAQPSNYPAALALFNEGRALEESGKYQEALDRFERSQKLFPAVGTLLNLGACYEELHRTASAWAAYNQAASLAVTLRDTVRQPRTREQADAIAPRVAKLTIVTAKATDLTVTLNGARVEPAALDTAMPVDAGHLSIEVTSPGRSRWTSSVDIEDGEARTVTIPELPSAAGGLSIDTRRNVGTGFAIGGGAVLATGLVFGALAIGGWSSVEDRCPDGRCPDRATRDAEQSSRDRASTFATVSTVTTLLGAAALAGGIVLHLTSRKSAIAFGPGGLTVTFLRR